MDQGTKENTVQKEYTLLSMILVGMIHVSVGIGIVAISSFLNSELAFNGWAEGTISIYLGIPILFELTRIIAGYYYDTRRWFKKSLIVGILLATTGLFMIPVSVRPEGNILVILLVSFFYAGTAILTTLIDSNLTDSADLGDKGRIAGVIQTLRLTGFAIGGIVGSILYTILDFYMFFALLSLTFFLLSMISILSVKSLPSTQISVTEDKGNKPTFPAILETFKQPMLILMSLFLVIYPIGLFMQDLILEPFTINILGFDRNNVGRIVAIWTGLTLVFVPVGVIAEKRIGKRLPIIFGEFLAFVGLLLIAVTYFSQNLIVFYTGLVLFGIGNGFASAPAISLMLDVASLHPGQLALLLGLFGIFNTVGRFLAALIGGTILLFSGTNYFILFTIEAVFVIVGLIPLVKLLNIIDPIVQRIDITDKGNQSANILPALDF